MREIQTRNVSELSLSSASKEHETMSVIYAHDMMSCARILQGELQYTSDGGGRETDVQRKGIKPEFFTITTSESILDRKTGTDPVVFPWLLGERVNWGPTSIQQSSCFVSSLEFDLLPSNPRQIDIEETVEGFSNWRWNILGESSDGISEILGRESLRIQITGWVQRSPYMSKKITWHSVGLRTGSSRL